MGGRLLKNVDGSDEDVMSMVAMKMSVQLEGGREENERKEEKDIHL